MQKWRTCSGKCCALLFDGRHAAAGLLLLLLGVCAHAVLAQSYPAKPIRIYTTGAGGGVDIMARVISAELGAPLGQPVIVENRQTGVLLATTVAKSPPDGYTLLIWGAGLWLGPLLSDMATYDPIRDFAPIATLTRSPNILMVHPALPVRTVPELIKLVKARPGQLNYSSGPDGTSSHLAGELFKSLINADIVRIAYKQQAQHTTDLLSGQVQMTFGNAASWGPYVKAGKLRALATGGSKRSALFPDLPSVSETLPGFVSESVIAFWATAKTPQAIVKRLHQEVVRVVEKPEMRERIMKGGEEPVGGSPEQLADLMKADMARVGKMIKAGVIKPVGS